jgi:hypothetical protein
MSKQQSLNKFYANKSLINCPKTVVFGHHFFIRKVFLLDKMSDSEVRQIRVPIQIVC